MVNHGAGRVICLGYSSQPVCNPQYVTSKELIVRGFRLYHHLVQVTPRYYREIPMVYSEMIAHSAQEHA